MAAGGQAWCPTWPGIRCHPCHSSRDRSRFEAPYQPRATCPSDTKESPAACASPAGAAPTRDAHRHSRFHTRHVVPPHLLRVVSAHNHAREGQGRAALQNCVKRSPSAGGAPLFGVAITPLQQAASEKPMYSAIIMRILASDAWSAGSAAGEASSRAAGPKQVCFIHAFTTFQGGQSLSAPTDSPPPDPPRAVGPLPWHPPSAYGAARRRSPTACSSPARG